MSETPSQLAQSTLKSAPIRIVWNAVILITWALWWGGLTFYASVVIPMGSDVVGSTLQGFVTQKVTLWHNALLVCFAAMLAVEAWLRSNRALWGAFVVLAVIAAGLFYWHSTLTQQLDFKQQTVPGEFYQQHAIYLWITTAEWFVGLIMPVLLVLRR
jgi:hypothetical protein